MINDLPQFDRLPLIPQLEEAEKEIFHPHWNCFCCQDSGFIQPHLVKKIIPDYNYNPGETHLNYLDRILY